MDLGNCGFQIGALQRAASQHRFLRVVKGNGTKLFPVADKVVLDYDFVNGQLSLSRSRSATVGLLTTLLKTYVFELFDGNMYQLRHLLVPSKDFTSSPPAACRHSHTREDAVILHEAPLKPHLHQDKFDVC